MRTSMTFKALSNPGDVALLPVPNNSLPRELNTAGGEAYLC